jgi:hypothetical protein
MPIHSEASQSLCIMYFVQEMIIENCENNAVRKSAKTHHERRLLVGATDLSSDNTLL